MMENIALSLSDMKKKKITTIKTKYLLDKTKTTGNRRDD